MSNIVFKNLEKTFEYFKEHREQAFIFKAALIIALVIYLKESFFLRLYFAFFVYFIVPAIFIIYIFAWSRYTGHTVFSLLKKHLTFIPTFRMEGRVVEDKVPWVTYFLIFLNIFVFYIIQSSPAVYYSSFLENNLLFLPKEPNLWNVPVSSVVNIFLHSDSGHLWGNMFFLWAFGTSIEKRIDSKDFLKFYFITALVSESLVMLAYLLFTGEGFSGLGASGAISGMMGVFAVRCYFTTMTVPFPILGFLPISFKFKVNSLILVGIYFMRDLQGGIAQIAGEISSNVAYWDHFIAMALGIMLAGSRNLHVDAVGERYTVEGIESLEKHENQEEGKELLRQAIEMNSENVEALLTLARIKSQRHGMKFLLTDEAAELYEKAIKVLVVSDPQEAGKVYVEYNDKFMKGLIDTNLEFRVAGLLHRYGNFDRSGRAFEMLAESESTPFDIKEKSLFKAAQIMEEMGLLEASELYYKRFLEQFPESMMVDKIKGKLGL